MEGGNGPGKCNKGPLQSVIRKSEHKDSVINQMLTFYFKFVSFLKLLLDFSVEKPKTRTNFIPNVHGQ